MKKETDELQKISCEVNVKNFTTFLTQLLKISSIAMIEFNIEENKLSSIVFNPEHSIIKSISTDLDKIITIENSDCQKFTCGIYNIQKVINYAKLLSTKDSIIEFYISQSTCECVKFRFIVSGKFKFESICADKSIVDYLSKEKYNQILDKKNLYLSVDFQKEVAEEIEKILNTDKTFRYIKICFNSELKTLDFSTSEWTYNLKLNDSVIDDYGIENLKMICSNLQYENFSLIDFQNENHLNIYENMIHIISNLNDLNIEYVCSFVEDDFEG